MAEWKIQDAQILVREESTWRTATAREISDAAMSTGVGIRQATGLRFGRISVSPVVILSGTLPDRARVCVGVRRGQDLVSVPDAGAQGIIHDSRWHPLDLAATGACFALLEKHALAHDTRLVLGAYLAIKADPAGAELLVDETNQDLAWTPGGEAKDFRSLGLAIDLFPYQQVGAEFLIAMASRGVGALLADEMGLGKTAQAITLLLDQRFQGPSLVVCPASLLRNWARELDHLAPALKVTTHAGPLRSGVSAGLAGHDVVITSYDTLVSDLSFMSDVQWNVAVLDEAQAIRNPDTSRAKSVKLLHRRMSLALTGTPVENRLLDLWSIAEYVVPALLGTREGFESAFPDEVERAQSLGRIIAPVTLRRKIAEFATELPEIIEIETAFELPRPVAGRYAEIAAQSSGPLAATTALRVLCAHADGYGWDAGGAISPKVDHTLRVITEVFDNKEKVLVFASFQQTLDQLFDAVTTEHPNAFLAVLDGRVSAGDRQATIDLFSAFPGPGALLMNPQAAGVGLNITAANHVIHFNPEWNPALTRQATARAHRRKQTLPVTVHHLFYVNTVEEDAIMRSDWKRALAGGVDDGATPTNEGPAV